MNRLLYFSIVLLLTIDLTAQTNPIISNCLLLSIYILLNRKKCIKMHILNVFCKYLKFPNKIIKLGKTKLGRKIIVKDFSSVQTSR